MSFNLEFCLENINSESFAKADCGYLDYLRCLFILNNKVAPNDYYTYRHSVQVSKYAYLIGHELGMNDNVLQKLTLSALMHDIGKTRISPQILLKRGDLSAQEYIEMQKHVCYGVEMIGRYDLPLGLAENILLHHERWDGQGYPYGLQGEQIPLNSRIIAVADSFDAMISDRPYHDHISCSEALRELAINADKQFDGYLAKLFINLIRQRFGKTKVVL